MNFIDIFHKKVVFPEMFLLVGTIILLIYGTVYSASAKHKFPAMVRAIGWLATQTLAITLLLTANRAWLEPSTTVVFNNVLIVDEFTLIIVAIIMISAIVSIIIGLNYIKQQQINAFEYIILLLLSTLSATLIVSSFDLISMYLAIELQSLAFYVLAAFQRNNEFSTEAGLKYFILGALSSGLLLFGESLLYGFTGLTNFEELTKLFAISNGILEGSGATEISSALGIVQGTSNNTIETATILTYAPLYIGLLFMLVAFLFKISAVPFHMWTPDVYEGAPTAVTAFFMITPKIAIWALILRLCLYTFYDLIGSWQHVIIPCAVLSMFIGTFGAIRQDKIKRLFAYSSIAHVGYLLISLATGTIEAIEASLVYIVVYTITTAGVFGTILTLTPENTSIYPYQTIQYRVAGPNEETEGKNNKAWTTPNTKWEESTEKTTTTARDKTSQLFKLCLNGGRNTTAIKYLKASYPIWDLYKMNRVIPTISTLEPKDKKIGHIKHITDLSSLSKTNPMLAMTMALILFSNAGIPPLAGFYGKLNVFLAAVEGSMYFLAIAGVLCSVIGAFYSIRLVKIIYYHSGPVKNWPLYQPITKENSIILALAFLFTLFFFLSPSFLFLISRSAAASICM